MIKLVFLLIAVLFACNTNAAYLRNVPVELKQPDGIVINCFITGDEYQRRVHDKDNYTIVQDPTTGYYVYAIKTGDKLVPSELVVGKSDPKQLPIEAGYDIPTLQMEEKRNEMLKSAKISTASPTKGTFYNLVVFIRFADDEEFTSTLENYTSLFNNHETGSNSLYNYYKEASNGQLEVLSLFYPISSTENVFSYKDSNSRNFYTSWSASNSIGYKDESEKLARETSLLRNAINTIKVNISDDVTLDGNSDGIIDNTCFIIKGAYDLWGNILWPHAASMSEENITVTHKLVSNYNIQIENFINSQGIRVICHEFFHSLGAPDLYRYENNLIEPVGVWDIMGSYDGQYMTAYMKWKYGKWFDILPEITLPGSYTLQPISKSPFSCFKIPSPVSTSEYFMVEYRENVGLVIYRINSETFGNRAGPPDEVYIYRPNGSSTNNGNLFDAAFSKNNNRIIFNSETNPGCFLSNGKSGQIDISDISFAGEDISFRSNTANPLPSPLNFKALLQNGQIHLSWDSPKAESNSLVGYNIYLGEESIPLNSTVITDLRYITTIPGDDWSYKFQLTAKYITGESKKIVTNYTNINNGTKHPKWINYTSGNFVHGIEIEGDYIWATGGGLNKYNTKTGENINYNHANSGLPANDVTALKIDKNGNKWIGMRSGDLVKFDGENWTTYKTPVVDRQVMNIAIDSKNNIWCATWYGGLLCFNGSEWSIYNSSNSPLANDYVWSLAIDSLDKIWIGLTENLMTFDGQNWTIYNSLNSGLPQSNISCIFIDNYGIKWIGTTVGYMVKYDDKSWMQTKIATGAYINAIANDKENNKWIGCSNGGLFKVTETGVQQYFTPEGILAIGVLSIIIDQNNNKWIGTIGRGLFKIDNKVLSFIDDKDYTFIKTGNSGLTSDRLWTTYFHKDGIKWVGTENGVGKFNGKNWEPIEPIIYGANQIKGDMDGNIWFATDQGIKKYSDGKVESVLPQLMEISWFKSVAIDNQNTKWFGSDKGLISFDGNQWKLFDSTNSKIPGNDVKTIAIDPTGNIWAGFWDTGSIARYDGKDWLIYTQGINGPASSRTFDLYFDRDGNLWVSGGQCNIVSKFNGSTWVHYNNLFDCNRVRQDENSQMWFARYLFGLATLKDDQYIEYTVNNSGLPSDMVNSVEIDSLGNKWITTYGGGLAVFNEQGVILPMFADAGTNQSVNEGATVVLDGSASSDPEGNPLAYKWTAPAGITLSSISDTKPTFIAPEVKKDSVISFSLMVNDGKVSSSPATVKITVLNVIKVGNSEISSPAFKVYPNPTTGILTLEFTQNSGKKTNFSVSNLIGAEVFRKELDNAANYQIDLSNQVSGIYLLKVIVDNRQYISKIVIRKEQM